MSTPARVVDLKVREPTPAEACDDLRAELYLRELAKGPPFPMWRILQCGSMREYAAADRLDCLRLELDLAELVKRFWLTDDSAELLEVRRQMLRLDAALDKRSIGTWVPGRRGWRGYLIEGRSL